MQDFLYHSRRKALSYSLQALLRYSAWQIARRQSKSPPKIQLPAVANPQTPEDFRPLQAECFQNPFDFYRVIRDEHPVYQLPNGIFCISRFEDIVSVSRDTDNYSSSHQGIIAGLRSGASVEKAGAKMEKIAEMGVIPSDVLALSDPPKHTSERKVGHKGLNARFVKGLESEVETLCKTMMDEFIDSGRVEFMQQFGWKLPMVLIIKLLGFPEEDFEDIKGWCVHGISTQSGISTTSELMYSRSQMMVFMRYCWQQYLLAKKKPRSDLSRIFVDAATDPQNPMTDAVAVSGIMQLLLAGSDSSATSMGNALKMLIDNPNIAEEIRSDIDGNLPPFIEEVFRLEAAFQGHFRWTKNDCELHGVKLPKNSRIFLMWASGNRDERVFDNPEKIDLQRHNGKKHLTFGHGIHACIGRELARTEIRIVLKEFLLRTRHMRIDGEAPFLASMFARTLITLPVVFEPANTTPAGEKLI
ncbi:Cytochrome P450 144 [Sinobacterium norvegicum]|uniref:Cytochrome P450 144 n=1 Tax=Sinobacterium norvegicum TaxID=1641715 RepID=A0ABN8ECL1_9GAMM|nr:cytochrome P450 [Sinobacterium norvegicum]CAH0990216.1 Cytochrome P450 144 [Sinobacterium norvegicum]